LRTLGGNDISSAAVNSCTEHENEEDHAFPKNYIADLQRPVCLIDTKSNEAALACCSEHVNPALNQGLWGDELKSHL
jgi:hypothetical protein